MGGGEHTVHDARRQAGNRAQDPSPVNRGGAATAVSPRCPWGRPHPMTDHQHGERRNDHDLGSCWGQSFRRSVVESRLEVLPEARRGRGSASAASPAARAPPSLFEALRSSGSEMTGPTVLRSRDRRDRLTPGGSRPLTNQHHERSLKRLTVMDASVRAQPQEAPARLHRVGALHSATSCRASRPNVLETGRSSDSASPSCRRRPT